jgi:hypothetical protein
MVIVLFVLKKRVIVIFILAFSKYVENKKDQIKKKKKN